MSTTDQDKDDKALDELNDGADSEHTEAPSSSFPLSSPRFWDEAAKVISPLVASAGGVAGSANAKALGLSDSHDGAGRTIVGSKRPMGETDNVNTPTPKRRVRFGQQGDIPPNKRSASPPLIKLEEPPTATRPSARAAGPPSSNESEHATSLSYLPNRGDPYSGLDNSAHAYLAGAEYAPNSFGDIGDYMRKKEIKVQTQNRDIAMSDPAAAGLPQIFVGQSFYINGNTHPPMEELRKMILQRGGEVRPVLRNKGMVKYIIAPMLTQMKFKQFQNYKVVKEGWITESCKEGKLLDWTRWKLTVQGGWEEEGRKGMEGFLKPTQASQASQVSPAVKTRQGDKRSDSQATTPVTSVAPQGPPGLTTTVNPPIVTKTEQASPQPPALPQLTARTSISAPSPQIHKPAMITPHRSTPAVPPRPHEAAPSLSKSPDPPAMGPVISPEKDKTTPKTQRPEGAFDFYSTKESNDDAARLLKNQEWRLKNTAERGNEGGFIDGYYQNSRLHHLSTWKAELRVLVAAAQRQSEENSLHHPSHSGISPLSLSSAALPRSNAAALAANPTAGVGGDKVIFHVDFDCFFVSCGLATRPHLRGKPAVVCHSQGGRMEGSTSEIASASYEARAKGVKNGMSLGRARTLVGEDLQTIPYEFETYKKFSLAFYTVLMGYADELQAVSVDEALVDATSAVAARANAPEEADLDQGLVLEAADEGIAGAEGESPAPPRKRDPAVEIAEKIRDEVRRDTGCEVSIGISHNILLAKLATRRAKPAGVFHLLAADVPSFLAPLDVEDFPSVGYSIRGRMEEKFGTTTVGELTHLSRGNIRSALGPKTGDMVWGYIRGADERRIEPSKERKSISAEMNYGIRFRNQGQAEICVKDLAIEVSKRMKNVSAKGRLMTLKLLKRHPDAPIEPPKFLGHGWCETFNKSAPVLTKGGGSTDDQNILGTEAVKLLRLMKLDPVELRGVGIQITKLDAEKGEREVGQGTLSFGAAVKKADAEVEGFSEAKDEMKAEMEDEEGERSQRHADLQDATKRVESDVAADAAHPVPAIQHASGEPSVSNRAAAGPSSRRTLAPTASSDGIDPDFLAALPEELQREVKAEHARTRAAKRAASNAPSVTMHPVATRPPVARPPAPAAAPSAKPTSGWRDRPPEPPAPPPARIIVRPTSTKHVASHISRQLRPKIKTQLKAGQIADLALYSAWNKAEAVGKGQERETIRPRQVTEEPERAEDDNGGRNVGEEDVVDLTASPEAPERRGERRRSVSTDPGTADGSEVGMDDGVNADAKIGLFFVRDLKLLGIDPEVFAALPDDMQREAVEDERRKQRQRKLLHRPADFSRQRARDRESERKLGVGSGGTGTRAARTGRTVSLSPTRQRGESRGRSTSAAPGVVRLSVQSRNAASAPRPSLLNAQDLPDVLNTIERWIASRGVKGPAERDSKKVEAYLLRLVDADQGLGGIEVAVECLKWMRLVLEDRHGVGESAEVVNATGADGTGQSPLRGQAKREWWSTWERFKSNVGEKVQLVLGAPLKL